MRRMGNVDKRFRFVVSVGGDGTFLEASHHVKLIPILGVNSDPKQSVARLSGSRLETFPKCLDSFLAGRLKPTSVSRLEFFINGRKDPSLVLNDLLVCTLNPAGTSRYILRTKDWAEEQMSSGLWIGTAAGSTAALLSAGGRVLPIAARKVQFVAREVYQRKFGSRKYLKRVLDADQTLEVISYMRHGRIFVDGPNVVIPFRVGDRVKVRLSKYPLRIVGLKA
jgi:NAD+ kinase